METFEQTGTTNPQDPFNMFEKLEYGINIYEQNMKLKFGYMGSISIRKHEIRIW